MLGWVGEVGINHRVDYKSAVWLNDVFYVYMSF